MAETTKTDRHIVGAKGEIVAHVRRTREDFEKRYGPISFGVPGVSNIISVAVAREIADALQAVIADVEPPAPAPLDECEHAVPVERAAEMLRLLDISLLTAAAHLRRSDILALASIPALLAALKEAQEEVAEQQRDSSEFADEIERLRDEVARLKDEAARARKTPQTECFDCPECGPFAFVDEDGCCAQCGADAPVIDVRAALKEAQSHESLRPNERAAYEAALEENRTLRAQLEEARRRHDEVAGERDALREAVDETDPVGSLAGDLAASTRRIVALRDALARAVEIIKECKEALWLFHNEPRGGGIHCGKGAYELLHALHTKLAAFVREQKGLEPPAVAAPAAPDPLYWHCATCGAHKEAGQEYRHGDTEPHHCGGNFRVMTARDAAQIEQRFASSSGEQKEG